MNQKNNDVEEYFQQQTQENYQIVYKLIALQNLKTNHLYNKLLYFFYFSTYLIIIYEFFYYQYPIRIVSK